MYQPVQNLWWLFRMNPGQEGWDHKPCNNQNISTSLAWYSKIASKLTNLLYNPCSKRAQQTVKLRNLPRNESRCTLCLVPPAQGDLGAACPRIGNMSFINFVFQQIFDYSHSPQSLPTTQQCCQRAVWNGQKWEYGKVRVVISPRDRDLYV